MDMDVQSPLSPAVHIEMSRNSSLMQFEQHSLKQSATEHPMNIQKPSLDLLPPAQTNLDTILVQNANLGKHNLSQSLGVK